MKNKTIDFVKRPQAMPDLSTFEIREIPMPTLRKGLVLIETAYISVDPYMRGRMREGKSYIEPFALGQPMVGGVVGRIVESDDPGFKKGDYAGQPALAALHRNGCEGSPQGRYKTSPSIHGSRCPRHARTHRLFWVARHW